MAFYASNDPEFVLNLMDEFHIRQKEADMPGPHYSGPDDPRLYRDPSHVYRVTEIDGDEPAQEFYVEALSMVHAAKVAWDNVGKDCEIVGIFRVGEMR